jgi:hypothetical protein
MSSMAIFSEQSGDNIAFTSYIYSQNQKASASIIKTGPKTGITTSIVTNVFSLHIFYAKTATIQPKQVHFL